MYIGRGIDKLSNIEKLDVITFDGSSSYSLTKGSVAFTPSSANSLIISIDGVVQAGNFTVSGSTVNFGTAIASTSTNNFILHFGTGIITTPADGTVTTGKIQDGAVTAAKLATGVGGKTLQVVSTTKTDTFTVSTANSSDPADITGLSVAITPASSSNKVLVFGHIVIGGGQTNFRLVRGSTSIAIGDAASNRQRLTTASAVTHVNSPHNAAFCFLDSPSSSSETTYKLQANNNGTTAYINRTATDSDSNVYGRFVSTITVMEISA